MMLVNCDIIMKSTRLNSDFHCLNDIHMLLAAMKLNQLIFIHKYLSEAKGKLHEWVHGLAEQIR